MGRKLASRLHLEGCDQYFKLRVAACCKWGVPEIATGLHAVQLHKDLGDGFENTFTQLLITKHKLGGEDSLPCEQRPKELHLISLEKAWRQGANLNIPECYKEGEAFLTKDGMEKRRHSINFLMVRTTND